MNIILMYDNNSLHSEYGRNRKCSLGHWTISCSLYNTKSFIDIAALPETFRLSGSVFYVADSPADRQRPIVTVVTTNRIRIILLFYNSIVLRRRTIIVLFRPVIRTTAYIEAQIIMIRIIRIIHFL